MKYRDLPILREVEAKSLTSSDGVEIFYEVVGDGELTVMLANGLGGRLYSWGPLMEALGDGYRFISWDYRGLFESGAPERLRNLSIPDHADDLRAILDAEGVEQALLAGWSMGVQVSLEFTTRHPRRVLGLVLLNGTYGQVLGTAFQPLVPLPYVDIVLHEVIDLLRARPRLCARLGALATHPRLLEAEARLLSLVVRRPYAGSFYKRYVRDVFGGDHFSRYLRLFQELDAHSVYHLLPNIEAPALIVYGLLDILTPAYQSRQMVRRMPNAEGFRIGRASHFIVAEHPQQLADRVSDFVREIGAR